MPDRYFITGIGTGVGKTLAAAVLTEAWEADYWKPVQAGDLDNSDAITVRSLISNPVSVFHPETFRLQTPASPHLAAQIDNIEIKPEDFVPPQTSNTLLIEGAGGLMVPLNDNDLMVDLIGRFSAKVILVSRHYLGSINHTLLSAELLRSRNLEVEGIIFSGNENSPTEEVILKHTGYRVLGRVPELEKVDQYTVKRIAKDFRR